MGHILGKEKRRKKLEQLSKIFQKGFKFFFFFKHFLKETVDRLLLKVLHMGAHSTS